MRNLTASPRGSRGRHLKKPKNDNISTYKKSYNDSVMKKLDN